MDTKEVEDTPESGGNPEGKENKLEIYGLGFQNVFNKFLKFIIVD